MSPENNSLNPALADLLGADEQRRLEFLYCTFDRLDLDLRAIALVLAGLMVKYAAHSAELLRDMQAAQGIVADAIERNTPCLATLAHEVLRIQATRAPGLVEAPAENTDKPAVLH